MSEMVLRSINPANKTLILRTVYTNIAYICFKAFYVLRKDILRTSMSIYSEVIPAAGIFDDQCMALVFGKLSGTVLFCVNDNFIFDNILCVFNQVLPLFSIEQSVIFELSLLNWPWFLITVFDSVLVTLLNFIER